MGDDASKGRKATRGLAFRVLLGACIFVVSTAAFSAARRAWTLRQPLPGLDAGTPRCALWFVGSSTISRWTWLASDMAPWPVVNRGVGGANLNEIEARFRRDATPPTPAAIVLYAGENDIAEGYAAADAGAHMEALLAAAARRYPDSRRLVIGLKPSPARWSQRPAQLTLSAALPAMARRTGAVFVADGEQLLAGGRPNPALYAPDGIHLNDAGYGRWVGPLRQALDRIVPAARSACLTRR